MASAFMPKTVDVARSWAIVQEPASLISSSPCAVVEHPGEDHADGAVAGGLGRRAEEDVDARSEPADGGPVDQLDAVAEADPPDHAVEVTARHDQRPAATDGLAVTGLGDLQGDRRVAVEPLGQRRGEPARHMLDDHDPGCVPREAREQPADGLDAPGADADGDDPVPIRRESPERQLQRREDGVGALAGL